MQPVAQADPILWQVLWILVAILVRSLVKDLKIWLRASRTKKPSIGVAPDKGQLPLTPSKKSIDICLL